MTRRRSSSADRGRGRPRGPLLVAAIVGVAVILVAALALRGGGDDGPDLPGDAYEGIGAWVDVFDYVPALGAAPVAEPDVDAMAAQGVRTIYLHAAFDSDELPGGLVPGEIVGPILKRAHERDMRVVGWYAPRFLDPDADLERLLAIATDEWGGERFDGVAVDIEDRSLDDIELRNERLIELSASLDERLGDGAAIGAVVLPTVLLERVNTRFWPRFPWADIAPHYDVWMPMTYWTDRLESSGYRNPSRYVGESVSRMRSLIGDSDAPVHPIGGIGDRLEESEVDVYVDSLRDVGAIGASIYDYRTMPGGAWGPLRRATATE